MSHSGTIRRSLRVAVCVVAVLAAWCSTAAAATGTTAVASGPRNTPVAVTHTHAGNFQSWQIERRSATLTNGSCGSYSTWAPASPANPASPWTDSSVTSGRCYQYRQYIEDTSYNVSYWSAAGTVLYDTASPTAALDAIPPYIRGTQSIGGTGADLHTGLTSITARLSGAGTATVCTRPSSPWSCVLDTTLYPDGAYLVNADVVDGAGNLATVNRATVVDNSPPVLAVTGFTELAGAPYLAATGSTIYVNPSATGSFSVDVSLADVGSGADHVDFPSLGTGWSPSAQTDATTPYSATYSFTPGMGDPGTKFVTSADLLGNSGSTSFAVRLDAAAPTGGSGAVDTGGTITFTNPTDALSGVATIGLQRRTAALAGGVCGSYTTWSDLGAANPTSPYVDSTLPADTCGQYRLVAVDRVGNAAVVGVDGLAGNASGDTTPPSGTISASTLLTGTVTISGAATDSGSGVAQVDVTATGPGGTSHICTELAPLAGDAWTCQFNTSLLADGVYTLQAVITDVANNEFTTSRMALIDTLPPTASIDAVVETSNPAGQHTAGGTTWINTTGSGSFAVRVAAADLGSGVASVTMPALGAGYTPASPAVLVPTGATSELTYTWTSGAMAPAPQQIVVADNAGRTTDVELRVATDTIAPTSGTIAAAAIAGGTRVTFTSGTDNRSGIDTTTLQRRSAPVDGAGNCTLFGTWAGVGGPTPSSPYDDTSATMTSCHEYRMVQTDYVGNQRITSMLEPLAPGKLIVDTSALRAVEEGGNTTYVDIVLNSRPSSPVTLHISTDGQVVADQPAVTIGTGSTAWSTPHRVEVSAVDDVVAEGPHTGQLTVTVDTPDQRFAWIPPVDVPIDVTDNDVAGATVNPTLVPVTEGGATAAVGVHLWSLPSAPVTIQAVPNAQSTVAGAPLTFSPGNWNINQSLDVGAVDDALVEASPHAGSVTFTVASADPRYDGLVIAPLTLQITDDDLPTSTDPDAPIGGSISYPDGYSRASSVAVEFTVGTDAGSGVASWRLQRRVGRYGVDQCLLYGSWLDIGAPMPASPFVDQVATHTCTQYRLAVHDNAGNTAYWALPSATVRADRTNPTGSIDDPAGLTTQFDGSAIDIGSGAVTVDVRLEGAVARALCTDMVVSETLWSCPVDTGSLAPGIYTIVASIRDAAGNTSTVRRSWTRADTSIAPRVEPVDREAPSFESAAMPQLSWGAAVSLVWSVSDHTRTAPATHVETRSIGTGGTWSEWQTVGANVRSPYAVRLAGPGTTTCARVVAIDLQGNTTRSGPKCATVPLDERAFAAKGPWAKLKSTRSYRGTIMAPRRGAPTLTTVLGGWDRLQLVAGTCRTCGTIEVLVNGKVQAKVSLRRAKAATRVTIPLRIPAAAAQRTVTLRAVAGSGRPQVDGLFVVRTR